MIKKEVFFILIVLISINIISASIVVGNESYVDKWYGISSPIKGKINISVDNEIGSSEFTTKFDSSGKSFTLRQLLDTNLVALTCNTYDCKDRLILKNNLTTNSIKFNLTKDESKTIGIYIPKSDGNVVIKSDVDDNFYFNFTSDGQDSCFKPLKIDISNDSSEDYLMETKSDEKCNIPKPYGCFNENDSLNSTQILADTWYCEKINVPAAVNYLAGAKVEGCGGKQFEVSMSNSQGCQNSVPDSSGMVNCEIKIIGENEIKVSRDVDICIKLINNPSETCKIRYETKSVCGYVNNNENANDFEIFAYPLKYNVDSPVKVSKLLLNPTNSEQNYERVINSMNTILSSKYNNNCSNGCIIPIKITAGIPQTINISNLKLDYTDSGIAKSTSLIANIDFESAYVSTNGFRTLVLNDMNISVPSKVGNYDFLLKLGSREILKSNISVGNLADIFDIIPHNPAALVPTKFVVLANKTGTSAVYEWIFGTSSPIRTNTSTIMYTFNQTGTSSVTLNIITPGVNSTKTVILNVGTPDDVFRYTITKYNNDMNSFSLALNNASEFVRNEVKAKLDLDTLKSDLAKLDKTFNDTFATEEEQKIKLMKQLQELNVPSKIEKSQIVLESRLVPGKIDVAKLDEFGVGTVEGDEISFEKRLNTWISTNVDVKFNSETYSIRYANGNIEPLFTDIWFKIQPINDLEKFYLIMDSSSSAEKIKTNDNAIETKTSKDGNSMAVIMKDLKSGQIINLEVLYPSEINIDSLPFYVSPDIENIGVSEGINIGSCNNNRKCDSSETYKNCPGDCKPWGITLILLLVLLFFAFVVYVGMQEWYRRYYESYLFTNKAQLFNLINYMYTASNQGTTKTDMFEKLKKQGWTNEQTDYAWKKLKGLKIWVWEVPVMRWFEKKQVNKEIMKRNPSTNAPLRPPMGNPPAKPQPKPETKVESKPENKQIKK